MRALARRPEKQAFRGYRPQKGMGAYRLSEAYWPWIVGGVALGVLLNSSGTATTIGGADKNGVSRDPALLLPTFRAKLEELFTRLRARGFDPLLNEGYRSPARAAALAAEGSGIVDSMHIYGAAADVKSKSRGFAWPEFFMALGEEAERIGLTWGGRFPSVDRPHVQAVRVKDQDAFRRVLASARDTFVRARIA